MAFGMRTHIGFDLVNTLFGFFITVFDPADAFLHAHVLDSNGGNSLFGVIRRSVSTLS